MISNSEKMARLRLIRSRCIGNATFWTLMNLYETAERAVHYIPELTKDSSGGKYALCSDDILEKEITNLRNICGRLVFFEDALYPPLLRNIDNPPPVLSFLGNRESVTKLFDKKLLSVVGARNASLNGMRFCYSLCLQLSESNVGIVSGLARGIDTSAHKGSVKNGTVAFLAGGINNIYPPENANLYKQILEYGGVFAEMPYNTYPTANLFPRRNNLIAGAADGVLVVEAAHKSGSLITAKLARDFERIVFAVPNSPIDARGQGGNELIKNGACVVTSADDVLARLYANELFPQNERTPKQIREFEHKIKASSISAIKKAILTLIDSYHVTMDEILRNIDAKTNHILQAVVELELAGKIRRIYGDTIVYIGK